MNVYNTKNLVYFIKHKASSSRCLSCWKMTKCVDRSTYIVFYVLVPEVCEQWNCRSSEMTLGMLFIVSSSKSSYMQLLPENGDFLLVSLPKTKKKQKPPYIKFKRKGNKLSVGRLVHTFLNSSSHWSLWEFSDDLEHGQDFSTDNENLDF